MPIAVRWSIGALGSIIGLHSDKLGNDTLIGTVSTYIVAGSTLPVHLVRHSAIFFTSGLL
ncbi:hypothetical protein KDW_04060 [Dictyobacter vulcani]|uniref:Uncharacterized protein n=2 Tax=Dictyobacter vulcani TaxID=2607529 RepID=A0A5J4KBY7_9CHLR|nr:hypothetical protein KDW_04060 [Dictyobacter vulcani]